MALGDGGFDSLPVRRPFAIGGVKAEQAQDAQIILANALTRFADEAHMAGCDILHAIGIVVEFACGIDG